MKQQYTLVITDDHPMVTSGLKAILNEEMALRVMYIARSGRDLLELMKYERPDLIILDISMPEMDGLQCAKLIRAEYPSQKILCISTFYQASLYSNLQAIPVQGFIPKLSDTSVLIQGIYKILKGENIFIVSKDEKPETNRITLTEITNKLSRREMDIMRLIRNGKSNKEIGESLFIATSTVETHRKNMCKKLNINSHNGLYNFALEHF